MMSVSENKKTAQKKVQFTLLFMRSVSNINGFGLRSKTSY
jgi:hypothetical protein